jgi:16S rRNA (cytidine1402-2'-O)-methyltransferase
MSDRGKLYIVGTPIGNLNDMTFRAIETLKKVARIAAEDTRHTGKLLQHFGITTPQISYHDHNRRSRENELLEILACGQDIALVTDAGMPGISDPGYELIKSCLNSGFEVIPIPGVTAVITALAASGLPTERFCFEGFLPTKEKAKKERLEQLQTETRTMIFYEAPHRLLKTLEEFQDTFGTQRKIVIARELTKLYEEFWRGSIAEALDRYATGKNLKGEFTIAVMGASETRPVALSDAELKQSLQELLDRGSNRSQACQQIAENLNLSRNYLYKLSLEL